MHSTLLLDEILRSIFEHCDRKYLVSAALTCKAWTDPALDIVWRKLDSSQPLLNFLEDSVNSPSFVQNASRVKHIMFQHDVAATDKPIEAAAIPFPKLRTLRLTVAKSALPLALLQHSSDLETIDLSLGFKAKPASMDSSLVAWFQNLSQSCTQLHHVRLRGSIPDSVNNTLCQMTSLRTVSLRLGQSMTPAVLAALGTFPNLTELEVHAGHIATGAVHTLMDARSNLFSVLTKLHIRGKTTFLETFLSCISSTILQHVHVELDDETAYADSWSPVLEKIASNTSLRHLSLEHHYDLDDIQQPNSTGNNVPANSNPHGFTLSLPAVVFTDISSLRSLKRLEHFSCNLTLPPRLSDTDFEQAVSWWPSLKHLDLGTLPSAEVVPAYPTTLTARVLSIVPAKAKQLEYLSIPCTVDDNLCDPNVTSSSNTNSLQRLLVSTIKTTDSLRLAEHLRHLFPSLRLLDCTEDGVDVLDSITSQLISSSVVVDCT